jgi:hypothetical protein
MIKWSEQQSEGLNVKEQVIKIGKACLSADIPAQKA